MAFTPAIRGEQRGPRPDPDGNKRISQYFECSQCPAELVLFGPGAPKPPDFIRKYAKNHGWFLDERRGRHLCAVCNANAKVVVQKSETPDHIIIKEHTMQERPVIHGLSEAMAAANSQASNGQDHDHDPDFEDIPPASSPVRQPQPTHIRAIFRELSDWYDTAAERFRGNETAHTIAERLKIPRKWVEDECLRSFGPISKPNQEMAQVMHLINQAKNENDAIGSLLEQAMDRFVKNDERIKGLLERMGKVETAVGPVLNRPR